MLHSCYIPKAFVNDRLTCPWLSLIIFNIRYYLFFCIDHNGCIHSMEFWPWFCWFPTLAVRRVLKEGSRTSPSKRKCSSIKMYYTSHITCTFFLLELGLLIFFWSLSNQVHTGARFYAQWLYTVARCHGYRTMPLELIFAYTFCIVVFQVQYTY